QGSFPALLCRRLRALRSLPARRNPEESSNGRGILTQDGASDERNRGGGRGPRARHQNIDGAGNDLDGPAACRLLLLPRSGSAISRRAVPGWKQKARGIAVKLDGNRLVRCQCQPPEPAMVYARMIEMGAAEDAPKIVKRLEWTGVSEDDQVEQPVDRTGLGGKQQAQSIT